MGSGPRRAAAQGFRRGRELAAAAACLKLTIPGDFALLSREEIERLVGSTAGGVVRQDRRYPCIPFSRSSSIETRRRSTSWVRHPSSPKP
jgi:hypothetical protein